MKQKLRGVARQELQFDFDLYRRMVPIAGSGGSHLSVVDLCPDKVLQTVVFVHGYLGCLETWEFQLNYFVKHGYRVIAPDLRGHGQSDAPDTHYTMPELVSDLQTIVETLELCGNFALVGHSFGGSICVEYAVAHPEKLNKLALIATAGEYPLPQVASLIFRLPTAFFRLWWQWRPRWNAEVHVMKRLMGNNLRLWKGWPLMEQVATPTLVLTGERDLYFPREAFERVGKIIPNAEVYDVGSAKHKVQLERHRAVNRLLERFINEEKQQASWRTSSHPSAPGDTRDARFWLPNYLRETPADVPIPDVPLPEFLERAAFSVPERTALLFYGSSLTYAELNNSVGRFAQALVEQGLQAGDRVMVVLPNVPQLVVAYYGILRAGGVVVMPNPDADGPAVMQQAEETGAGILVTLDKFIRLIEAAEKQLGVRKIILAELNRAIGTTAYQTLMDRWGTSREKDRESGTSISKATPMASLLANAKQHESAVRIASEQLAVIIFTSGTTDSPKGVCLSHKNLVANVLQTRHWTPQLRHGEETFLSVIPLIHSYGMTNAMNIPIAMGATIVLLPVFEAHEVLTQIQRHKPTAVPGVPSMFMAISQTPNVRTYGLSSIRACISGAAPLPVEVKEAFEKLTKGRLVEGYGLTEASPVTHANPLNDVVKLGSIGVPIPNTEARVVDLITQRPMGPGEIGELQVRGPQVMLGYWRKDGSYDRSCITESGWLFTGDVAVYDRDGYFQLISRKRDTIMAGDFSVYPRDVEEVLYENNKVMEVAVVGISSKATDLLSAIGDSAQSDSSERQEQKVKAFVVPRPGVTLTKEELLDLCTKRLEAYAVPWDIEFRQELPKSFTGKVLRRVLVQEREDST